MWIDGDALRLVGASTVKPTSSFDLRLIRTLGKAFYWQRMIDTGEVASCVAKPVSKDPGLYPGPLRQVARQLVHLEFLFPLGT